MYKVLEVSPTAKCSPGVNTEPCIYSHGRVHSRLQVRSELVFEIIIIIKKNNNSSCSVIEELF